MDSGYSRIPVYEDSIDNIVGIFYTKEIIREYIKSKGELTHEDLRGLMREAFFVVGSKKISDLLKVFQFKNSIWRLLLMNSVEQKESLRWKIFWKNCRRDPG
jgi:CBS domain containing-hemolysin-like protein